jgi:O-succinylbenzoate synthase
MPLELRFISRDLQFKFDARTSRGQIKTHTAYYICISSTEDPETQGWGEAAPLAGLSIDFRPDFAVKLLSICESFNTHKYAKLPIVHHWLKEQNLQEWPAIKFGLETAFLDFETGGKKQLFDTGFTRGEAGIPINGLVWMGDKTFMQDQIEQKLAQGYSCLKLKIGGLDFDSELKILASIREVTSAENLTIRLDANGAFTPENTMEKLEKLSHFQIHSIEQPIQTKQYEALAKICKESPIPIALDEELIGIYEPLQQVELLDTLKPQFIILKPTLVGGFQASQNWINLAEERKIAWWITSALESNIGLNAIAQFTSTFPDLIPQGLGTGQLYSSNISSPLTIEKGYLYSAPEKTWEALYKPVHPGF